MLKAKEIVGQVIGLNRSLQYYIQDLLFIDRANPELNFVSAYILIVLWFEQVCCTRFFY
jgi:hypothetical protein